MKKTSLKGITSAKRLEETLEEIDLELESLQPKIEKLEKELEKLKELKLTKQKLITLKLSIKSIVDNFSQKKETSFLFEEEGSHLSTSQTEKLEKRQAEASETSFYAEQVFLPDQAFTEANQVLKQKTSLNYEIFRAIVFHGGRATTEQIKTYLVENSVTQPTTGEGFEQVGLTDISSRVNYLVRKGIVRAAGKGLFISSLGWEQEVS
jgi:hypothetical protein